MSNRESETIARCIRETLSGDDGLHWLDFVPTVRGVAAVVVSVCSDVCSELREPTHTLTGGPFRKAPNTLAGELDLPCNKLSINVLRRIDFLGGHSVGRTKKLNHSQANVEPWASK